MQVCTALQTDNHASTPPLSLFTYLAQNYRRNVAMSACPSVCLSVCPHAYLSELLDSVKTGKIAYYGHTMRKQGSCLEKEIVQGTMPGARRRGRSRTAWVDNIKTWTGLPVEESIRMTEDRDK